MEKKKLLFWSILLVLVMGIISAQPTLGQRISPGDVWQRVYQELPDFPKENKHISKETGKVATDDTLVRRLIRYHIYVKGRSPIYRLDWKLTLADYLGINEIMYENAYPGSDTLRDNPMDSDCTAISHLTRRQRNALVQVLVNIFNPSPQSAIAPQSKPDHSATPQLPQQGGAELLK
jgi:hypothetical protein